MARMFAAVVPPLEVVEELSEFLEPRREADDRLRWTDPESWHVTLAFMAQVGDAHYDRLVESLEERAERHTPFDLLLGGAGVFPNPYDARVLWLGASDADAPAGRSDALPDRLAALATATRNAATQAGVTVDGAGFTGHVTLARMRRSMEATRWLRVIDSFTPMTWTVDEFVLMESHLGQGRARRPRYEVREHFSLARRCRGDSDVGDTRLR